MKSSTAFYKKDGSLSSTTIRVSPSFSYNYDSMGNIRSNIIKLGDFKIFSDSQYNPQKYGLKLKKQKTIYYSAKSGQILK